MIYLLTLLLCLLPVQSWAAVGFGTIGTAGAGTTSLSLPLPASLADGDLMVMCIGNKYPANGPSTPSGWTAPSNNQGTGDPGDGPGADVGATYATIYYKVAASESGNVAVTITSGNSSYGFIARYTNATGLWSVAAANGGDATSGTAWSATMGTDPGIEGGDMVVACSAKNSTAGTASGQAITQTGVTFGAANERGDNGTSFGDNVSATVSDHAVTSITTPADTPVYVLTNSTNTAGGTAILRIRETAAAGGALQPASGYLGAIIK